MIYIYIIENHCNRSTYWIYLSFLFSTFDLSSQTNDGHSAIKTLSEQRDGPTKERHSALSVWTWIQKGHQHSD